MRSSRKQPSFAPGKRPSVRPPAANDKPVSTSERHPKFAELQRRFPRHLTFTREGRFFVLVVVGVGAAAVNTGNNLIYLVLGLMLSLIIVSGVLSDLVLIGLQVTLRFPEHARVGQPCEIEVHCHNKKRRLNSYTLEMEVVADDGNSSVVHAMVIRPKERIVEIARMTPKSRGLWHFGPVRVSTGFPFALFTKTRIRSHPGHVVVYPKRVQVARAHSRFEANPDAQSSELDGQSTDTLYLREYRDGDEIRRIHFRKSAARGTLVTRSMSREVEREVETLLEDMSPRNVVDFEAHVSEVASTLYEAEHQGRGFVLACESGQRFEGSSRREYHEAYRFLALVQRPSSLAS